MSDDRQLDKDDLDDLKESLIDLYELIEYLEQTDGLEDQPQRSGPRIDPPSFVNEIPHSDSEIPLIMRRSGVKSSRNGGTLQVRMYKQTEDRVTAATHAVRGSFDESTHVSKMDINEALVVAGLLNLDDVHKTLKTWGYGQDPEDLDL
jgi:hypothetical protein